MFCGVRSQLFDPPGATLIGMLLWARMMFRLVLCRDQASHLCGRPGASGSGRPCCLPFAVIPRPPSFTPRALRPGRPLWLADGFALLLGNQRMTTVSRFASGMSAATKSIAGRMLFSPLDLGEPCSRRKITAAMTDRVIAL